MSAVTRDALRSLISLDLPRCVRDARPWVCASIARCPCGYAAGVPLEV